MPGTKPAIAIAATGLLFMSESDYPLEPFGLEAPDPLTPPAQLLLKHLGLPASTPVQEQKLDYFLRNHTRQHPAYAAEEKETARRFQHLRAVLEQELKEIKVYRLGEVRVQAFILGRDNEGHLSGLKTTLVET
jgi:hypothetical protein